MSDDRCVFRVFRARLWTPWERVFEEVAAFVSEVGRERVISISHRGNRAAGIVTVWYWE